MVSDPKLRDEIIGSIASKLMPRQKELYDYTGRVELTEDNESVQVFSPDDLENYLSDILHGKGDSGSVSSRFDFNSS